MMHRHRTAILVAVLFSCSKHCYERNSPEVLNLHALNVFDNLTLLKMWGETTPRAIFPQRNIGLLQEGYEASFLVLGGNPLDRFEEVTRIKIRFKEGRPLSLSPY